MNARKTNYVGFEMHHINHCIYFLLTTLSIIIIGEVESVRFIVQFVEDYSENGTKNIIDSNDHILKVSEDGILYESEDRLVCKGTYDGLPVAIKITSLIDLFIREINVYEALNAMNDPNAEKRGIPQVYYHGNVCGTSLKAIAMSLFEGTVEQEYNRMTKPFSDFSVLLIFKEAVKTLEYLNSKDVLHNDIKPKNLFLSGTKVFIADFDLSTLNGIQGNGFTRQFASSNHFAKHDRFAMDDLESLIFSMWHVASLKLLEPCGEIFRLQKLQGKADIWLKKTCKQFKNKAVREVFTDICTIELLSGRRVPHYGEIINLLSHAIDEVTKKYKQTEFEWLSEGSSSHPFKPPLCSSF